MIRNLFLVFFILSSSSFAQEQPTDSFPGRVDLNGTHKNWNLEKEEWEKYKELMMGEAGLFHANVPPSYVLAIYETDPEKKRKYVEQSFNTYNRRVQQTTDMYRRHTLYAISLPQEKAIDTNLLEQAIQLFNLKNQNSTTPSQQPVIGYQQPTKAKQSLIPERYQYFITLSDCDYCDDHAKTVINKGNVDIYFLDAKNKNEIIEWANKMNIQPDRVTTKDITLNFDDYDLFSKLGGGTLPKLVSVPRVTP